MVVYEKDIRLIDVSCMMYGGQHGEKRLRGYERWIYNVEEKLRIR